MWAREQNEFHVSVVNKLQMLIDENTALMESVENRSSLLNIKVIPCKITCEQNKKTEKDKT